MANVSFTIPSVKLHPDPSIGSPEVIALCSYAKNLGVPSKTRDGMTTYYDISEIDMVSRNSVQLCVFHKGEVNGLPMFIKMPKAHAETTDVPDLGPSATITNDDGTTRQKKRIEFAPYSEYDDTVVVYMKEGTDGVSYFTGSQYVLIAQDTAITMMSTKEHNEYTNSFNTDI